MLLEDRLAYVFNDAALLQQALTHRSHGSLHNERLEFLGDSILNCVVASLLFERYSKIDEGDLSRLRANLVKQQSLYEIAQRLELSQFLRLGEGELKSGGFRRPSILADTLEALFGAIFLDAGFNAARDVIRALYIPILDTVDPKTLGKDAKTLLQEYLQGKKIALPQYSVVATHGAAHSQEFEIECLVPKLDIQVFGTGGSRRAGEQAAAKLALEAVQSTSVKTAAAARKARPKTAQMKLAGIATVQNNEVAVPPVAAAQKTTAAAASTLLIPSTPVTSALPAKAAPAPASQQSELAHPGSATPTATKPGARTEGRAVSPRESKIVATAAGTAQPGPAGSPVAEKAAPKSAEPLKANSSSQTKIA